MTRFRSRRQRGMALIWVALVLLVLIGIIGLAIDFGYLWWVSQQLQQGADAAALAGTPHVLDDPDAARAAAMQIGAANTVAGTSITLNLNGGNAPDGDIVIGRFDRSTGVFTPTDVAPRAMRVVARRNSESSDGPVGLLFGRIFGVTEANITREAIATMEGGTGAGLIVLDPDEPCALHIRGNVFVDVEDGNMQINSTNNRALCVNGNAADTNAAAINVVGDAQVNNPNFSDLLNPGADEIPDPLAELPDYPYDTSDPKAVPSTGSPVTLEPGYYPGGISATGGTLNLESGIYVLDGAGLDIGGNTNMYAEGVMFYIVGSGSVQLGGTGHIVVTPSDPTPASQGGAAHDFEGADIYEGVSIFQARSNTNESTIIGTSDLDLQGTLYFPEAHLNLGGTGSGFGNQLIAGTMEIFGTGNLVINYDGRNTAPGSHVFLVR
ncbi:MAG: TadE/TadG family type IV pilus assembly protein [Phycisphaeraceae bacterium]